MIELSCFYPLGAWSNLFTEFPKAFFNFFFVRFVEVFVCWFGFGWCVGVFFVWLVFWVWVFWGGCFSNTKEFQILYFILPVYQKVSKKALHGVQCSEGWSGSFDTNNTACGQSYFAFCRLFPLKLSLDYMKMHSLYIQLPFLFQGLRMWCLISHLEKKWVTSKSKQNF